jgi:non-ribosomal peptide synthetase component F
MTSLSSTDSTTTIEGQEAMPRAGATCVPALADPALRPRDACIPPDACLHELFAAQAARTPAADDVADNAGPLRRPTELLPPVSHG